jgi:hypothetical protein
MVINNLQFHSGKSRALKNQDKIMARNVESLAICFKVLFYYLPGRDLKFFAGKAPNYAAHHTDRHAVYTTD